MSHFQADSNFFRSDLAKTSAKLGCGSKNIFLPPVAGGLGTRTAFAHNDPPDHLLRVILNEPLLTSFKL